MKTDTPSIPEPFFIRNALWVLPLISIILAFVAVFLFTLPSFFSRYNFHDTGQIGDTIGGITAPTFNLIAGLIIFYSFREQLRANKIQSTAIQDERKRSQIQQVENLFFSMMNILHDIIQNSESEKYNNISKTVRGIAYYSSIMEHFKEATGSSMKEFNGRRLIDGLEVETTFSLKELEGKLGRILSKDYVLHCFVKVYSVYQGQLGHLFRYIFNIIKFVDENENLPQDQKIKLINLIQAQVSNDILGLIFYNSLTSTGKKFKDYLEKYPFLLENIDVKSIIQSEDIAFYPKTYFKYIG